MATLEYMIKELNFDIECYTISHHGDLKDLYRHLKNLMELRIYI